MRHLSAPLTTREDYEHLIAVLRSLPCWVIAGFEAASNYHWALVWRLLEASIELRLISSVALARTREALHNSSDKNDSKNAQVILHMLRIGLTQHYQDPLAEGLNDIQELSKTHEAVSKAKTGVLNGLQTHDLPLYFHEFDHFRHNSRGEWFFAFLDRFPTPASVTALDQEAFINAAWHGVGRKVSKARLLADIYKTAQTSVGLPVPPDAPAIVMLRMVVNEAHRLIRQRDTIEHMAHELLQGPFIGGESWTPVVGQ